jgi:hypothetical protein
MSVPLHLPLDTRPLVRIPARRRPSPWPLLVSALVIALLALAAAVPAARLVPLADWVPLPLGP